MTPGLNANMAFLLVCGLALANAAHAQHPAQPEREAMYNRYLDFGSYAQGGSVEPHWMADGSSFWYTERGPDQTVIWKVDPVTNTKRPLFDVERLRCVLSVALGHEPPGTGVPFDGFTFVNGETAVRFAVDRREFLMDLDSYDILRAGPVRQDEPSRTESPGMPSPDGRWTANIRDYNLWLISSVDGREIQLTEDGEEGDGWWLGAPAWSGQDRAQWSPDGFTLATKKVNSREAARIPLVDWLRPNEEVAWAPFPRKPGQAIERAELFLIDIRSGSRIRVDTGDEPDQRMFLLGWLPDGSSLLFLRLRAGDPSVALMTADPTTGGTRVLLREEHPVRFRTTGPFPGETPFTLIDEGRRFLWISGRTSWRHLYLYDISGRLVRPLTQGKFPLERVVRVDETTGWVYLTARADTERPYDIHLFRASLEGEGFIRLTDAPGQRHIRFAPSGRFFLDTHSSVGRGPTVELRRADGELLRVLTTADVGGLEALAWRPPEEFVVKAADGTTHLYGVLYKPFDFDAGRNYPVILQTSAVVRTFPGSTWLQALAQLGFVTFSVDVREPLQLVARGGEFHRIAVGTMGRYEVPDYVAALRALAADRPYMDLGRVGVVGTSYGGYHAIRAMLQAPDVFHVGVGVNAIADAYSHPNFYVLGSPQRNREAFDEASNIPLAANLEGRLLLVHGTHDISVPFAHAMKMADALARAGKFFDLLVLPNWDHWGDYWGWTPQHDLFERYWREAVRRYFQEHLEP